MRVVIIGLSPSIGMQFYSAGLASALVTQPGYDVSVIGSVALRSDAYHRDVRLLPAHSFSSTGLSPSALNPAKFYSLLRQIEAVRPNVVHITTPHLWNLPLLFCLRRRYPLVLTRHDAVTHEGARGELVKGIYRRAEVNAADAVVVHSQAVARILESWKTGPAGTTVMPLVHHCFDYGLYEQIHANAEDGLSYDNLVVLFGRLEKYKGVWEFIDAARLLCTSDGLQAKMVIAGTGRLSEELAKCECPPNLEIRNYLIKDAETIELFRRAGLIVLPYSEASQSALIPLAYLFRKPVLVTRVGALPEYVRDNVTGRIIDSNEPMILAQAIHHLLSDKEALAEMGRAGRAFLHELETQLVDGLGDTYARVTQDRNRV
ncbi:MAG: glycosyltransferase family 4 protein [Anaerolineae bacterium]|nr:glycosyltransferase family 4 protein [Anaerolineae bacterium]